MRGSLKMLISITLMAAFVIIVIWGYIYINQHKPHLTRDQVETEMQKRIENGFAVGMALSYIDIHNKNQDLEYDIVVGTTDLSKNTPITENTLFQIGSISKTFTATLLAIFILENKISLEDEANKYLPEGYKLPSFKDKEIKIKHLITHTSGLISIPHNLIIVDPQNPYQGYNLDNYRELLRSNEKILLFEPGTNFTYSNLGMAIMGYILSQVGKAPFDTLVKEKIFIPLDMKDSTFQLKNTAHNNLAVPYTSNQAVRYWTFTPFLYPTGGIISNLSDMKKYVVANLECKTKMTGDKHHYNIYDALCLTHQPLVNVADTTVAMSFRINHDGQMLSHTGGAGGFTSFLALEPDKGRGGISLSNSSYYQSDILLTILGERRRFLTLPNDILQDYVGYYKLNQGAYDVVKITYEDNQLSINTGFIDTKLYITHHGAFFSKGINGMFKFEHSDKDYILVYIDENGKVKDSGKKLSSDDEQVKKFEMLFVP